MFKAVLGLGKAGILPPRRSNGTGNTNTNTSHDGTHDLNASSPQEQRTMSVVTDSQALPPPNPRPNTNGNHNNNLNFPHLRRNINHAAASGVTGAPKESEIITIGSPNYKDDDHGVGAASAEPLVEIEEASNEKTATAAAAPTVAATVAATTTGTDMQQIEAGKPHHEDAAAAAVEAAEKSEEDDEDEQQQPKSEALENPPKKRSRQRQARPTSAPKKRARATNKPHTIADLIGQVVEVPGSVFSVTEPEYYVGDIKKRDPQHRNAVEVLFREDNSRYWFPVKDVVKWLEEHRQRNQVEIIMEEGEEQAGGEEEEQPPVTAARATAAAAGVETHVNSAKDMSALHNIDRNASLHDEKLAAQALTDISASGGGISGATPSASAGGGGGGASSGFVTATEDTPSKLKKRSATPPLSNVEKEKNARGPSRLRNVAV